MTFNNRGNKCTTIGAFQVTSFISNLLATETSTDIIKNIFITYVPSTTSCNIIIPYYYAAGLI